MASRERERQLARERYERQQARRAAARARARQRRQIIGAVVGVLAVIGGALLLVKLLGTGSSTTALPKATTSVTSTPSVTPSVTPSNVAGCAAPPATKPKTLSFPKEPPLTAKKAPYTATLTTNCGAIVVELYGDKAPHAVNSFLFLAGKGYFDNAPCHRLTTSGLFVLQCGDPTGTGRGGPGYKFPDENLPKAGPKDYPAGTLAMANSGSGTNGSQFFIVYKDTQLESKYTIFGRILRGSDVVDRVRSAGVGGGAADGPPLQRISILSVKTVEGIK